MSISNLDARCLVKIYQKLPVEDVARGMCVQKHWKEALKDDAIWQQLGKQDWLLDEPLHPCTKEPLATFREAVQVWEREMKKYKSPENIPHRMVRALKQIFDFYSTFAPEIMDLLRFPGIEESTWEHWEQRSTDSNVEGEHNPPAEIKIFYKLFNGQGGKQISSFQGLFGGFSAYDMGKSNWVPHYGERGWYHGQDGQQWIQVLTNGTRRCRWRMEVSKQTREVRFRSDYEPLGISACPAGKTFVDWLEEFALRLSRNVYHPITSTFLLGNMWQSISVLSLFPMTEEYGMRQATTNGIRVRVSPLYMTTRSTLDQHWFAYSVGFSLLSVKEQRQAWPSERGEFRPVTQAQLRSRHWYIRDGSGNIKQEVAGPGVIGVYPELKPGEQEFRYESCTAVDADEGTGSMDGHFAFCEGTLSSPLGDDFNVQCPRFTLFKPDYIF